MISNNEISNLSIEEVWNLYKNHINPSQVKLISSLSFGHDLVEKSEGCWIFLKSGRKILDLTGGIGVLNHGHNHPRILSVRKMFNENKKMEVHKNFFSPYLATLAHNVSEMLQGQLPYSYFPNSGAEAVEGALKIAYKHHKGKRKYVLHTDISFHGKLLGAASVTASAENHFSFPKIPNCVSFKFNDLNSVTEIINKLRSRNGDSEIYAVIVEPLSASSMQELSSDFLVGLRKICSEFNIVLIFDEVYTGWGKTGFLFNFMRLHNLWPDILVYAKSFGGGKASISGYSYNEKIAQSYNSLKDVTLHSSTYYGFGEESITAIEALNIIKDEKLVENANKIGKQFNSLVAQEPLSEYIVKEVRGRGALWGVELKETFFEKIYIQISNLITKNSNYKIDPKLVRKLIMSSIVNELYEKHDVLTYFGFNQGTPLIISFPLIANESEVLRAYSALSNVFNKSLTGMIMNILRLKLKTL